MLLKTVLNRLLKLKRFVIILNYFRAKKEFSSGVVEAMNNNAKLTMRRAYGFKSRDALEIALFHQLGALPEPPITSNW